MSDGLNIGRATSDAGVALVTGASRGIGRGIAIELARVGFDVIINYRTDHRAAEEAASLALAATSRHGARIVTFQADISEAAERRALLNFAKGEFNRLDLLVNNAGVGPEVREDLLEAGEESFDRIIRINLKGPYFLTQAVARWMIERLSDVGQASSLSWSSGPEREIGYDPAREPGRPYMPMIVNIGSISAYAASVDRGDYCVSKAGLSMMTTLFAARLASEGINVYEVRPGIIRTDLTEPAGPKYDSLIAEGLTPIRRWGTPEDVGRAVAAIASRALPFSTGEIINVDGGFHLRSL